MECILALQRCDTCKVFTIHGLWFHKNSRKHKHFHIPQQLAKQLERLWVSYPCYHHNNQWLWEHEYNKHGFIFNTPENYFKAALKAYRFVKASMLPHFLRLHLIQQPKNNQIKIKLIYRKSSDTFDYPPSPLLRCQMIHF